MNIFKMNVHCTHSFCLCVLLCQTMCATAEVVSSGSLENPMGIL